MAKSVEQIERDIAALEKVCREMATELTSAYNSYLADLAQAVQQQLILASYHLITQGYPQAFLNLSLKQRQQMQQAIRKIGKQASEQLLSYSKLEQPEENSALLAPISNPIELAIWQQNLEQAIANTLKAVSHETNHLLQQTGILPHKLPLTTVLEAAKNAETSNETMPGPPNLLNLLIETENDESQQHSTLTQLVAMNLQLGEIEFSDLKLRTGRNQIRNILLKANSLEREYSKKQRELTIAEAEAAWRASWFDD